MAEGSSQTIDRIQVEISADTSQLDAKLQSVGTSVDTTKTKLSSLESSSTSASKGMDELSSATSSSKIAFDECNSAMISADKTLTTVTKYTSKTADGMKNVGTATKDAAMGIDVFCDEGSCAGDCIDWIPEAASNMEGFANKTGSLGDKAKKAQSMIGALKGGLAGLGVTAGISAIITKFNEMADAARAANDAYDDIKKNLISYTGELNEDQLKMVDSIYVNSVDSTGFTDRDQVTKAVGSAVTLWSDATAEAQKEIATELSTLQALGRISDTGSYAETAKGAFAEWGVSSDEAASSMEYLYYVSQQTGVGMEDLTSYMSENADTLQKMGYTFSESANLIGSSWNSIGSMKDMDSLISSYTTNYESKLESLTTAWQEAHGDMTMSASTLKDLEEDAESWALAQAKAYGDTLPSAIKEAQADAVTSAEAWETIATTDRDTSEKIRENTAEYNAVNNPTNALEISEEYEKERENIQRLLQKYGQEGLFGMNVNYWAQQLESYGKGVNGFEGTGKSYEEVAAEIVAMYGDTPVEVKAEVTFDKSATEEAIDEAVPEAVEVPVQVTPTVEGNITGETVGQVDTKDAAEGMEDLGKAAEEASDVLAPLTTDVLVPMNTELAAQGTNLTYNYDATMLLNDTSTNVTVPTVQTETTYVAALAQEYWNLYYAKLAAASV